MNVVRKSSQHDFLIKKKKKSECCIERNESALGIYSWIFQKPFTILIVIGESGVIPAPFYYAL